MRSLLASLLLTLCASAQIPFTNFEFVGMTVRRQTAHWENEGVPVPGSQLVGVIAEDANSGSVGNSVGPGATIWLFSGEVADYPSQLPIPMAELDLLHRHYYSLTCPTNNTYSLPFASPLHDLVFNDPIYLLTPNFFLETNLAPDWSQAQDPTHLATPNMWGAHFRRVQIPENLALVGMPLSVQSFRFEYHLETSPLTYIFDGAYFSDEVIFLIGY